MQLWPLHCLFASCTAVKVAAFSMNLPLLSPNISSAVTVVSVIWEAVGWRRRLQVLLGGCLASLAFLQSPCIESMQMPFIKQYIFSSFMGNWIMKQLGSRIHLLDLGAQWHLPKTCCCFLCSECLIPRCTFLGHGSHRLLLQIRTLRSSISDLEVSGWM